MQNWEFEKLDLDGAYLIKPFCAPDQRGCFIKDYSKKIFKQNGIEHDLQEVFYAISHKGVIRGLHFQLERQQPKLVRCLSGHIYDVIIDLRPNSSTFGSWRGFYLSGENMHSLLVPKSFGHGYLAIEDSMVSYKCAEAFYAAGDSGIKWDDTDMAIDWPINRVGGIERLIISDKDQNLMSFQDYKKLVKF